MWKKSRGRDSPKHESPKASRDNPWHAVSILSTDDGCEAVRSLRRVRFLSREAPRLPLPPCANPAGCQCAYKHHADRRAGPRRKEELTGFRSIFRNAPDRRERHGRRETD